MLSKAERLIYDVGSSFLYSQWKLQEMLLSERCVVRPLFKIEAPYSPDLESERGIRLLLPVQTDIE